MGRTNRSRKRRDAMNRIKRERYAAKELERLKKTLGLIDKDGNVVMKDVSDVATVKSAKELKKERKIKQSEDILQEVEAKKDIGENITVLNEKTGKEHTYNTKTFKDQHGSYPPWFKPKKTQKRMRKLNHSRKQRFNQAWTTINVPL